MKNFIYEFRTRRVRRSKVCEQLSPPWNVCMPNIAATLVRNIVKGDAREQMIALLLDIRNHLLGFEIVAIGSLTGVDVHPREIFRPAIVAPAAAMILAHNHPSGTVEPSAEDYALTRRMTEAGELMGIPVLDHVIVTETNYWSFSEHQEVSNGCKEDSEEA